MFNLGFLEIGSCHNKIIDYMFNMDNLYLLKPLGFLLFFMFMWIFITVGLAYASGWVTLADKYKVDYIPRGTLFNSVWGMIGKLPMPIGYRNALKVIINADGFYLSVIWIFSLKSPPLFIPWLDVEAVEEKKIWFRKCYQVKIREQQTMIALRGEAGKALYRAYTKRAFI